MGFSSGWFSEGIFSRENHKEVREVGQRRERSPAMMSMIGIWCLTNGAGSTGA